MGSAIDRTRGISAARLLFAVLGVLALLVHASPAAPHSAVALLGDNDLVYDIHPGGFAVVPKLERDKSARGHPGEAEPGDQPGLRPGLSDLGEALLLPVLVLPQQAPLRFHHLEERASAPRGPPLPVGRKFPLPAVG